MEHNRQNARRRARPVPGSAWLAAPLAPLASLASLAILALTGCPRASTVPAGQDPEKVSRAELDLAQDEWRHRRVRSAMEHAQRAAAVDEAYAEAQHFVAILYLDLCQTEGDCRFAEAEKYARRALSADSELRSARHTLGVVLVSQKKYDEAVSTLRPLAEDILYKTPELAWYDLGGAYIELGQTDKAIDALQHAVALKPTFCWANYRLGLAFEQKRDLARADEELSKAVEPADPTCKNLQDAYEARARVRARLGRAELAKQDAEACIRLSPSTPAGKRCASTLRGAPPPGRAPTSGPPSSSRSTASTALRPVSAVSPASKSTMASPEEVH